MVFYYPSSFLGIMKIFNLFADEGSDVINLNNLKRVAKELGETMTVEECNYFKFTIIIV